MKINTIFVLGLSFLSISCSNSNEDCRWNVAYISENCECDYTSKECSTPYFIYDTENERLMNILNESTDPCVYVLGKDNQGNSFEGYLLELNTQLCPELEWY